MTNNKSNEDFFYDQSSGPLSSQCNKQARKWFSVLLKSVLCFCLKKLGHGITQLIVVPCYEFLKQATFSIVAFGCATP